MKAPISKIPNTVQAVRIENLNSLIKKAKGKTALAHRLQVTSPYITHLTNGHRPFSEKAARKFEATLDLAPNWFDQDHTHSQAAPSEELEITKVILAVGAAFEKQAITAKGLKFAEVVTLVLEQVRQTGHLEPSFVERLVRLIK